MSEKFIRIRNTKSGNTNFPQNVNFFFKCQDGETKEVCFNRFLTLTNPQILTELPSGSVINCGGETTSTSTNLGQLVDVLVLKNTPDQVKLRFLNISTGASIDFSLTERTNTLRIPSNSQGYVICVAKFDGTNTPILYQENTEICRGLPSGDFGCSEIILNLPNYLTIDTDNL